MAGGKLDGAKNAKADEFYTQLSDIEKEVKNYKEHFKNKTVFCNCDDPENSNFYYYFVSNFDELGLKKLITTHFELNKPSYMLEYIGGATITGSKDDILKSANSIARKKKLKQNFQQGSQDDLFNLEPVRSFSGDFRSPECIELLEESDIVVTNPPFSLFRDYIEQLMSYNKKFLIIGNINAITYKEVFKYIKENKMWTGVSTFNQGLFFEVPEHLECQKVENGKRLVRVSSVCWFTNLDHRRHHEEVVLWAKYNPDLYPKFDNYDAIEVSTYKDIPFDYEGIMGVPITFIDKYNPEQFEIVDGLNRYSILDVAGTNEWARQNHLHMTEINGISKYFRILIRNKKVVKS